MDQRALSDIRRKLKVLNYAKEIGNIREAVSILVKTSHLAIMA